MVFRDKAKDGTTRLTGGLTVPGPEGPQGPAGRGVSSSTTTYQASASGVLIPGGTWVNSPPATTEGQYLWSRTVLTYTDATTSTSYSVGRHGLTGPQGIQGIQGIQGNTGATGQAGRGIVNASVMYQASASGTVVPTGTWTASVPATTPGQYLWSRTVITYTDSSTSTLYSVGKNGDTGPQGIQGNTGATGSTGPAGVGIASTSIGYQVGVSGTVAPAGAWSSSVPSTAAGQYLWTRVVYTYSDGMVVATYSVARHGLTGAQGNPGPQGIAGTRWGKTDVWFYADVTNILVEFVDGGSPRIGDLIVSNSGFGPGDVAVVTAVIDSTHVDVQYLYSIRGPEGPAGMPVVQPAGGVIYNAAQNIPTATWTLFVNWNAAGTIPLQGGMSYSGGRFTVPSAGIYSIAGAMTYNATTNRKLIGFIKNGVTGNVYGQNETVTSRNNAATSTIMQCAAGDLIGLYCYVDSAQGTYAGAGVTLGNFEICKISE